MKKSKDVYRKRQQVLLLCIVVILVAVIILLMYLFIFRDRKEIGNKFQFRLLHLEVQKLFQRMLRTVIPIIITV